MEKSPLSVALSVLVTIIETGFGSFASKVHVMLLLVSATLFKNCKLDGRCHREKDLPVVTGGRASDRDGLIFAVFRSGMRGVWKEGRLTSGVGREKREYGERKAHLDLWGRGEKRGGRGRESEAVGKQAASQAFSTLPEFQMDDRANTIHVSKNILARGTYDSEDLDQVVETSRSAER